MFNNVVHIRYLKYVLKCITFIFLFFVFIGLTYYISRCLEKAPLLEHLELSCLEEFDETMMQALYKLPLRVLRLPGVRVKSFPPIKPLIQELSCLSLNTHHPTWAFQGPFGLLTNNTCPSS